MERSRRAGWRAVVRRVERGCRRRRRDDGRYIFAIVVEMKWYEDGEFWGMGFTARRRQSFLSAGIRDFEARRLFNVDRGSNVRTCRTF